MADGTRGCEMSKDRIEVGDVVNIEFSGCMLWEATVLHVKNTDDGAWAVRMPNGDLVYVQQYEMMRRRQEKDVK